MPSQYRHMPLVVEAMRVPVDGNTKRVLEVFLWIGKYVPIVAPFRSYKKTTDRPDQGVSAAVGKATIEIYKPGHVLFADRGDYVVRENSDFTVYTPQAFKKKFQPLTEESESYGGVLQRTTEV